MPTSFLPTRSSVTLLACAAALLVMTACSDEDIDLHNGDTPDVGVEVGDDTELNHNEETDGGPQSPDADEDGRPDQNSGQDWDWDDPEFGLASVSPARGPVSGGTQVFVHGSGLTDGTRLLFGDKELDARLSQGQLVAETPPTEVAGPVTVRAISSSGEVAELPGGFRYVEPLEIDEVLPTTVPSTGGIEITLRGRGFSEPMGVSFSGEAARRIDVINSTTARVITPPMPRGHADLRVTVTDTHYHRQDHLYFFDPIAVDVVEPAAGSVDGGDQVILRGSGLTPDTTVSFGGIDASIQSVNMGAGELYLTTPPAAQAGAVDLRIENEFDTEILSDGFYFGEGATPYLHSLQPAVAPLEGGSEHLVSGWALDGDDLQILVGDQPATVDEVHHSYAIITAPSVATPGARDLVLRHGGQEVDRLVDALTYQREVQIDEIDPAKGSTDGGQTITLTGEGLSTAQSIDLGGLPATFEIVDDETITVTTPASEPGTVDLRVQTAHGDYVVVDGFTFDGALEIWSMVPTRGALAGNTLVTLHGTGFAGAIEVALEGDDAEQVRRLDPYTVTFRTPPANDTGPQVVTLSAAGQQAEPPQPFIYFNPLSSFGGAHGPAVNGSINVSVVGMDGTPIPGAFVMLSTRPDTPYRGFTNTNGQITLSGSDLRGPQMITATAAGMSTFTVRELNAQNLTVILNPTVPPEGGDGAASPIPIGLFRGNLTVTGKGTDPESGREINMSKVRVTRTGMLGGQLNPGENSVVPGEGSFEVRSRVGDLALVALCGRYDEATDRFTPKLMGVARNLAIGNQQIKEVDLDCDIPLESTLPVKITNPVFAPDGPNINEATAFIDFGFEGYFRMPTPVQGLQEILHAGPLPRPEGVLEGVRFAAVVGSYTGQGLPYTQTTFSGVPAVNTLTSSPPLVAVPELLEPANTTTIDGEIRIGLKGSNEPDFFFLVLRNAVGLPVWTFVVPGGDDYIPMPEFPEFSGLPREAQPEPYQPGALFTLAYGIRIDSFNYNAFTWGDFQSTRWSGFSVDTWLLRLTD